MIIRKHAGTLLFAISIASSLSGCGSGIDNKAGALVESKALVGTTPVERSLYPGQHFDSHAWLETPLPAPQSSAIGPVDGYQFAELETIQLAQLYGHDQTAMQDPLSARISTCNAPHCKNYDLSSPVKEVNQ